MKYNGKILGKARAELSARRESNKAEHEKRVERVYASVPEIAEMDRKMRQQMIDFARIVFSGQTMDQKKIEEENLNLQMRRSEALVSAGYPVNYLDEIYSCPNCHDTGYDEKGRMCKCLDVLYNKALTKELSSLMLSGDESFETFDLSLYPDDAKAHMTKVKELCQDFASPFVEDENLLLYGPPGLGKTFLSACIAREVVSQGYSVVYDTTSRVVDTFEKKLFGKDAEQEEAKMRVDSMLNCDLMILDDLGTERSYTASASALYTLINTRLQTGKATVISTNLLPEDLPKRYSSAICSRIQGLYTALDFVGNDIRKIRKVR